MRETRLKIAGMACDGCAERLQKALTAGAGVRRAEVSYASAEAVVRFNEHAVSAEDVGDMVRRAGFEVVKP